MRTNALLFGMFVLASWMCMDARASEESAFLESARRILDESRISTGNALVTGQGAAEVAVQMCDLKKGWRIRAVEPNQSTCNAAREMVDGKNLYGKITVAAGPIDYASYAPFHFDLVYLNLASVAATEKHIEGLYRLLKPGGCGILRVDKAAETEWKRIMLKLGLRKAAIRLSAEGDSLVYHRPGPDPKHAWGAWFKDAYHNCAVDSPDFKPPLVELWNHQLAASDDGHPWVIPVASDGVVVYRQNRRGYIRAHDGFTGKLLWTAPSLYFSIPGKPRRRWMTVPAMAGGTVLAVTSSEELRCMDSRTGRLLWKKPLPEDMDWDGKGMSLRHLSVHNGTYYLLVNKDKALNYDPDTGKETVIKPVLPYRAYMKVGDLVFYPNEWTFRHSPLAWAVRKDGKDEVLYTFTAPGRPRMCVAEKENVLIRMDWAPYSGHDLQTGQKIWKGKKTAFTCSGPTYAGGYFWATASGVTYAHEAKTGNIAWMARGANSCVPPIIANGILYTISNNTERLRAFTSANLLKPPGKRSK